LRRDFQRVLEARADIALAEACAGAATRAAAAALVPADTGNLVEQSLALVEERTLSLSRPRNRREQNGEKSAPCEKFVHFYETCFMKFMRCGASYKAALIAINREFFHGFSRAPIVPT
jgi:hypothetical protein